MQSPLVATSDFKPPFLSFTRNLHPSRASYVPSTIEPEYTSYTTGHEYTSEHEHTSGFDYTSYATSEATEATSAYSDGYQSSVFEEPSARSQVRPRALSSAHSGVMPPRALSSAHSGVMSPRVLSSAHSGVMSPRALSSAHSGFMPPGAVSSAHSNVPRRV